MGHYNDLSLDLAADAADLERDGYHDEARTARRALPRPAQLMPPAEGTFIEYDRVTRDYAMFLDSIFIGYRPTFYDAETALNDLRAEHRRRDAIAMTDDAAEQDAANEEMSETEYDECIALAAELNVDLGCGHWNEARQEVVALTAYAHEWDSAMARQALWARLMS